MPKGIPNDMHGICQICGRPYQKRGWYQKYCGTCRLPARIQRQRKWATEYYRTNRDKVKAGHKRWYEKNRENQLAKARDRGARRRMELKQLVIAHYSNHTYQCACCGEAEFDFLAVDHVNGHGNQHRQALGGRHMASWRFCSWLVKNGLPPGYQILCHNCNMSKGKHGVCVHRKEGHIQEGLFLSRTLSTGYA